MKGLMCGQAAVIAILCFWGLATKAEEEGKRGRNTFRLEGDGPAIERLPEVVAWRRAWEEQGPEALEVPELEQAARDLNDRLRAAGYLFSLVRLLPPESSSGVAAFDVDLGRIGRLSFTGSGGGPFRGRWFSEEQLKYRLFGLMEGRTFEEDLFYQNLLAFNAHPDLTAEPVLRVRRETGEEGSRRVVDIGCAITERFPLHGALTVDNAGFESSGEWRASVALQYVNLTRYDDILTVYGGPFSWGGGASVAGAASYYRPIRAGRGGHTLWYVGYADVDAQQIAEIFRIRGAGWFLGGQAGMRLQAHSGGETVLTAGAGFRRQEERFSVETSGGAIEGKRRTLDSVPVSLLFRHTPFRLDGWGGRIFWELEAAGGILPGDQEDIQSFRPGVENVYGIGRIRLRRLQVLGRSQAGTARNWMAAVRLEGQAGTGALPAAEQLALGGMESIRGFPERAVLGDWGGWSAFEGRSPVWNFGSGVGIQLVGFVEGGHVGWETMEGERDSLTLAGAGGGIRLSLGSGFQIQADYGVPLTGCEALEERGEKAESSGRFHFRALAQF